ncbi:MAG: OmpA family protein [Fibromonadales bacterium]|nr:OmpA family protein [Fibromonadales bacterium]
MKKTLIPVILVLLCATAALASQCDEENQKVIEFQKNCLEIGKGNQGYKQCAREFNAQRVKAEQVCNNLPLPDAPSTEIFRSLLKTINFEFNSTELTSDSYAALDSIAALFMQNPNLRYEIQGHSDSVGSAEYNELLSGARAGTVRNYIISEGVPKENIIAIGYGSSKPLRSNNIKEGRAANRRVEIQLIESQEKYEELKENETKQRDDIRKAGIVTDEPEQEIESEDDAETEDEEEPDAEPKQEPKPEPESQDEDECDEPQQKSKIGINIGFSAFFANDFGGGVKMPEININKIKIPSAETKNPWTGGGTKIFFDFTYAELGLGMAFGNGDLPFTAIDFSLLGKYPIELSENTSLFPAIGIDYLQDIDGDYSALWFKFGAGMDFAVNEIIFIRPALLYGIRQANQWEKDAAKPVISDGKKGSALLGHGFTINVGVGFRI